MKILAICFGLFSLTGCGEPDTWNGWVYPDGANLLVDQPIGEFETLELCRDTALAKLESEKLYRDGKPVKGDYECGLNCESSAHGINICEETRR